jgi:hypothetical protein
MPGGSGRKLIAEQTGAAFPGALVADCAGKAAKASAQPIATMIVFSIAFFSLPQSSRLYSGSPHARK